MSSTDPHQGGDLSDMAATGTKMPNDAGDYDVLPSKPHPTQQAENPAYHDQFINSADPAGATDNIADMPRTFTDSGVTGGVIIGTGDQMPASVEQKRLGDEDASGPAAKGHPREAKGTTKDVSNRDKLASEGAEADPAPGEEDEEQDVIRDRKGI